MYVRQTFPGNLGGKKENVFIAAVKGQTLGRGKYDAITSWIC